ncbi:MAG: ABC transporter ATP-binding protein [Proteobacteria bacterium]|nr:ABC transporter ATP-binding protein [Pseudomonadota bacterium]
MLKVERINFSYKDRNVLEEISFEASKGDIVSILGVNGSGKTTLLKIICGILKPKNGNVYLDGRLLTELTKRDVAKNIAYMQQRVDGISSTVFDTVLLGRRPHINFEVSKKDLDKVEEILTMLNLSEIAFRNTHELSGGELQKVFIARALAQEPKVLLLDEPISHLDIKNQMEMMTLIRRITKKMNLTTLLVIHDISMAIRFADKFLFLKDGQVHVYGNKNTITSDVIKNVYLIDATIENVKGISIVLPILKEDKL